MTDSSIPVSTEFRESLQERKPDGTSYEEYLQQQLDGDPDAPADGVPDDLLEEIDAIVDRRLEERFRSFRDDLLTRFR